MIHIEQLRISNAFIQYQDHSGNWINAETIPNETAQILWGMERVASNYSSRRVRCVDVSGHVLDIL